MDPQHRLLLEVSWQALEHAGIVPESLSGAAVGLFMGGSSADYSDIPAELDIYSVLGTAAGTAVGRISYLLGLKGPAMAIDTACSSALVAVHLACQSLRSGESDLALAGGVNALLHPRTMMLLDMTGSLSRRGACSAFDASADGPVRSEGCGVVVLKRLADARRDGDFVFATIRGSAVNQDGRSQGLTAPNGPAQTQVIRSALTQARLAPSSVDYVEAHGTGTALGDPIELHALDAALREGRPDGDPVLVGAVKTNLGHMEAAAGAAGLIKAALVLHKGEVPPNLHFERPNPNIQWQELRVSIAAQRTALPPRERLRVAGVSSFGFGGTNCHVLLEEAPPVAAVSEQASETRALPLCVSARGEVPLKEQAARWAQWLQDARNVRWVDVVRTAALHRSTFDTRAVSSS